MAGSVSPRLQHRFRANAIDHHVHTTHPLLAKDQKNRMSATPRPRPRGLPKSKILQARQCPKRLWLQTHRPELAEEGAAQRQRLEGGIQFGELARTLLGSGTLIEHVDDLSQALAVSRTLLDAARPGERLFEAALSHDGVLVRADALERTRSGWILTEVKSSTEVKPYHSDDLAVQT